MLYSCHISAQVTTLLGQSNNNNISLVLWHYLVMNHVVYTFISWWGRRFFSVPLSSLFLFPLTLTIFFPYCHLLVLQMGFCAYHCGKRFHTTLCLAARDISFSRHTYPILRTASDTYASVSCERLFAQDNSVLQHLLFIWDLVIFCVVQLKKSWYRSREDGTHNRDFKLSK